MWNRDNSNPSTVFAFHTDLIHNSGLSQAYWDYSLVINVAYRLFESNIHNLVAILLLTWRRTDLATLHRQRHHPGLAYWFNTHMDNHMT
jgi:hypothetical protein